MISPMIVKFLKTLKPEEVKEFFDKKPNSSTIGKPIPSPRAWEIVSNILQLDLPEDKIIEMIKGTIGEEATKRFLQYVKCYKGNITIDDLKEYFISSKKDALDLILSNNLIGVSLEIIYIVAFTKTEDLLSDKTLCETIIWFINYIINSNNTDVFKELCKINGEKFKAMCSIYKDHYNIDVYSKAIDKLKHGG